MTGSDDTPTPARTRFWSQATRLLEELNEATDRLSASKSVDAEVTRAVTRLVETFASADPEALTGNDPYLVDALLVGTLGCAKAMWLGDDEKKRRELRIPLERSRQALRDLVAERHVALDRAPKDVARWVVEMSGVPQSDIAELLGVSARTLQRWISPTESAAPSGSDEVRLRTLARTIDQLRWSMTPAGVVSWLRRPHPGLKGRVPADLLDSEGAFAELPRLAAATRAMVAT